MKQNVPATRMQFYFKPATDYEKNKFQIETTIHLKVPQKTTQKVSLLIDMPTPFCYCPTSIYKYKAFQGLIDPRQFSEFPEEDPSLFVWKSQPLRISPQQRDQDYYLIFISNLQNFIH